MGQFLQQLLGHLRGMWNRRAIGLAAAWIAAIVGVALAFTIPEKYEASTRVQVDTQSLLKPVLAGLSIQPNLDQQVALISRTLLNRANMEKLVQMTSPDATFESNSQREALIDRLTRTIQISGNANSNLYVITYRDTNPQQAEKVVSSLLNIFFESSAGDKRQDSKSALKFLDEQIARYEQSLQLAENRLKDFRLKYMGVPGQGGPAGSDYFARASKLGDDIAAAKLELLAAAQSRDAYKRELAVQTANLASVRASGPPVAVPEVDARLAAQKAKLDELLRTYTDQHPDVAGTRRVIAELEAQRQRELVVLEKAAAAAGRPIEPVDRFSAIQQIRVSYADAEAKVASAQSKLASYEGQYAQLKASGRLVPQVEAENAQLNRDYDIQKKTYTDLLARREATVMGANAQDTIGEQFHVIDPPRVAPQPVQPTRLVLLVAAFFGAIGAGLLASFVANEIVPTYHDAQTLSDATDRPLLGTLSMLVSETVNRQRRRGLILFAGGVGSLVAYFVAVLAIALMMGGLHEAQAMSLIEQAAKRLAELQRAGAEPPEQAASTGGTPSARPAEQLPTPEALVRAVNAKAAESSPAFGLREGTAPVSSAVRRVEQADKPPAVRVEIDLASLRDNGFVTPDMPQSTIAHELRVLKRPIIRNAQGGSAAAIPNGTLVMVTSALPGEGKTFTAVNLAISLAMEFDHTVMLVDGDVAHPTLLGVLGLPQSTGLLDLLTRDDLDISDVLLQTNLERLTLLPAGTRHRRATELIASEKMGELLRKMAKRYPDRIIIFDSPPLLATTEARVLATHMGQIVMVVAADSTARSTVRHALATIERCNTVMMMLNKAVKSDAGSYYGYYADDVPD